LYDLCLMSNEQYVRDKKKLTHNKSSRHFDEHIGGNLKNKVCLTNL